MKDSFTLRLVFLIIGLLVLNYLLIPKFKIWTNGINSKNKNRIEYQLENIRKGVKNDW